MLEAIFCLTDSRVNELLQDVNTLLMSVNSCLNEKETLVVCLFLFLSLSLSLSLSYTLLVAGGSLVVSRILPASERSMSVFMNARSGSTNVKALSSGGYNWKI